jgi:hypothetical protein
MEQFDIKNSKEVLRFAFALGNSVKQAKANDGKIDMMDIGLLMQVIPLMGPAFEDIALVPKELKDLSLEEGKELQEMIVSEFGALISKEKVVEQINLGFKAALSIYEFIKALK